MRAVLSTFLTHPKRDEKLGTGPFHFDADRDLLLAENDGNVLRHAHHRLRDYQTSYSHAIIVLDFAFEHQLKPERIVDQIQCNMVQKGWSATRFEVVLIQPELEAWIWQEDSPLMQDVFYRWLSKTERDALPPLRIWLRKEGLWPDGLPKPPDPKAAVERARVAFRSGSPMAIYTEICRRVSVARCQDPAFVCLRDALRRWFPTVGATK
jgi:hypothetical protein